MHRGAFCKFPFRWIYYYVSNKSTGKGTGKTHLCALVRFWLLAYKTILRVKVNKLGLTWGWQCPTWATPLKQSRYLVPSSSNTYCFEALAIRVSLSLSNCCDPSLKKGTFFHPVASECISVREPDVNSSDTISFEVISYDSYETAGMQERSYERLKQSQWQSWADLNWVENGKLT